MNARGGTRIGSQLMSERPNVRLIRQGYAAFASGDLDSVRDLMADGVLWHEPGRSPIAGDYKGPDGALTLLRELRDRSDGTFTIDLIDVVANGERVIALQEKSATRKGRELDVASAARPHLLPTAGDSPLATTGFPMRRNSWSDPPTCWGREVEGRGPGDAAGGKRSGRACRVPDREGRHMEEVKDYLGHSSIRVTSDRYGHLFPAARVAIADALDARFRTATKAAAPQTRPTGVVETLPRRARATR
jgi:ketosteroid isomerase-like protein